MTRDSEEFVDPNLQAAIKRARGGHTVAPALRQRVVDQLAAAMREQSEAGGGGVGGATSSAEPAIAGRIRPGRIFRKLAAAAAILLIIGIAGGYWMHARHEQAEQRELAEFVEDNESLLKAMIAGHNTPIAAVAGAQPISVEKGAAAARDEAARQLGRRIPVPELGSSAWVLTDAAIVPLHSASAARFDFARSGGSEKLTLFSFPGNQLKEEEPDGESYDVTVDGHAIAGYTADKGVHCIVGDKSLPLSEAETMRKHLQQQSAS